MHTNVPILGIQGDMGWVLPEFRYHLFMIRYWNRLLKMENHRLPKKIMEYNLQNISNDNWCSNLCNIFTKLNLSESFVTGQEINLEQAKHKLYDLMHIEWLEKISSKAKLRTYSLSKTEFAPEPYVTTFLPKFKKSLVAQLRNGILPLNIEIGRYYRINLDERLCTLCKLNNVEDEIHILCTCTAYSHIRSKYFPVFKQNIKNFVNFDIFDKFINILTFYDSKTIANFVQEIWNCRKTLLFKDNS